MGVCGGKAAKNNASRELRFNGGIQYSLLEANDLEPQPSVNSDSLDIVQFAAPIFVAAEGEDFKVELMRLGSLSGRVSCYFQTEASSGKAGSRYVHTEGEVIFEDGQFQQSIDIEILDSPTWAATLEFKILLSSPMGCTLGKYLKVCRVKVLDGDSFPTSAYAEVAALGSGALETVSGPPLFVEFCKLMLRIPGNTWRFGLTLLFDQLKNAYVWFMLVSSVYMVNVIFGDQDPERLFIPGDAEGTAQVLGLMYIILPLILHIWKEAKTKMDITGRCSFFLQTSMMRKYMNYSSESRAEVTQPEVQKLVDKSAVQLGESLNDVSSLLETLGKLIMLNSFAISSDPGMLWAVVTMPVVMGLWVLLREFWLRKPEEDDAYVKEVSTLVGEISEFYPLIAGYFQRPTMNERFAARVTKLQEVQEPRGIYDMRSEFFFDWFLATISVFKEVSSNFASGFGCIKSIIAKFNPLLEVTVFLNRTTDVADLRDLVKRRVAETADQRKKLMQLPVPSPGTVRTDMIPIRLEDVHFKLPSNKNLLQGVNVSVEQGKLVALVGLAGSGKTKLIQMLASGVSPTSGKVLIPSHLRCLLVSHRVYLMHASPLQNLFFGDPLAVAQPEERHRMMWILDKLQMSRTRELAESEIEILQEPLLEEDDEVDEGCCYGANKVRAAEPPHARWTPPEGSVRAKRVASALHGWQESLSFQEKAKLHIARAVVMNPEILILEKPLMNFDDREADLVVTVLKEYVSNRGVAVSAATRDQRRPRTCFYSAERVEMGVAMPDVLWKFENATILPEYPQAQLVQDPKKGRKAKPLSSPKSAQSGESP